MYLPPKVARRNLLQYAESIGGKEMYLRMNKALRDSGLHTEESLNRKQVDAVVDKLSEQEDFHMDKMKLKKLIDEKERRREVYVKMAIESETDELYGGTPSDVGGIGGSVGGKQRYDYRKMPQRQNGISHTAQSAPVSSISRLQKQSNKPKSPLGTKALTPKSSAASSGPVSSIAHIKR